MKIFFALSTLTLLLTTTVANASVMEANGRFEKTLTVNGPVQLSARSGSGDIKVMTGADNAVHIVGRIHAGRNFFGGGMSAEDRVKRIEQNPPVTQSGNTVTIGEIDDAEARNHVSIDYDITVPADTTAEINTGSGDIKVSGLLKPLTVHTGSGDVVAESIGGNLTAVTGSGDVTACTIKGGLDAHTGSGNIVGDAIGGAVTAHASSGDIEISQTAPGDDDLQSGSGNIQVHGVNGALRAHTGSGDVRVEGTPRANWSMRSGSGNIDVTLPTQTGFNLRADSSSGGIHMDREVTVTGHLPLSDHHFSGAIAGGGPEIAVETGSGTIHIH